MTNHTKGVLRESPKEITIMAASIYAYNLFDFHKYGVPLYKKCVVVFHTCTEK